MHVAFFLTLINKMMNKNLIYVYFYACSCMSPVGLINAITQLIKFRIVQLFVFHTSTVRFCMYKNIISFFFNLISGDFKALVSLLMWIVNDNRTIYLPRPLPQPKKD